VRVTVDAVIDELGFREPADLVDSRTAAADVAPARRQAWREASERVGIDAAFFRGTVPLVYFRGLSLPSEAEVEHEIKALHLRMWNHNRAPFLVVVLPNEVRILDAFRAPFENVELERTSKTVHVAEQLRDFNRASILSGHVASRIDSSRRESVVDRLRTDLRRTLSRLRAKQLRTELANDLVGRSLFVRYLQDRNVLDAILGGDSASFSSALEESVEAVYSVFERVYEAFNGDAFPVTKAERAAVRLEHLGVISDFLRGGPPGQLPLFDDLYDFSVIPVELLSNIYEEFLADEQHRAAAFYTPEHLVDLALNEVFPPSAPVMPKRILDPACGSGIFLARAFRRLIEETSAARQERLSPDELKQLLSQSIFGCDVMESAARVAALSCYLVLLDHCDEDDVARGVRFPHLLNRNIHVGDFFDLMDEFGEPFDLIASNPPWKVWTDVARDWVKRSGRPVGDKQLAQAFFWASIQCLAHDGNMSILMPAKVLYNRSGPNVKFRSEAVADTGLDLVVDLSAFRRTLFASTTGPAALFVVRGRKPRAHVTFCTPHPSPLSKALGRIVVSADDIKRLPRADASYRPDLWKATLAGTMRDANLIQRLQRRLPSLSDLELERGWVVGAGFQIHGGERHQSSFLSQTARVDAGDIGAFSVAGLAPPPESSTFHRVRNEDLFRAPHVVVARAIDADGYVQAAFLDRDAGFNDSVLGIAAPRGKRELLEALTAILNSKVVRYALFLTATSWGVERPRLEIQDLRILPIAVPKSGTVEMDDLVSLARDAAQTGPTHAIRRRLDSVVAELYELGPQDRAQVDHVVTYGIDLHNRQAASISFMRPTAHAFTAYAKTLAAQLGRALDVDAEARVGQGFGPYATVSIGLNKEPGRPAADLAAAALVPEDRGDGLFVRRVARIYRSHEIEMAKPAERRQWTRAAALQDADDIVDEILRAAEREEHEEPAVG
jgi:SAM-dependent methyltransferase